MPLRTVPGQKASCSNECPTFLQTCAQQMATKGSNRRREKLLLGLKITPMTQTPKQRKPKPAQKSLLALSKEIPEGKYKGLSKILEPHETTEGSGRRHEKFLLGLTMIHPSATAKPHFRAMKTQRPRDRIIKYLKHKGARTIKQHKSMLGFGRHLAYISDTLFDDDLK